jgi:signal transduction histidine kinase
LKLRKKMFLIFGLSYILVFLGLFFTTNTFLMSGFIELEDASIEKQAGMGVNALKMRINELDDVTHGFAAWDNSYYFIQSNITHFIDSMLLGSNFVESRISFLIFVDNSGRVVYSKAFDIMSLSDVPFPSSVMGIIVGDESLKFHELIDDKVTGILSAPEGLFMVSSRPILTSEKKGPIMGTLICGRLLDALELEKLKETTFLSLEIHDLNGLSGDSELSGVVSKLSSGETIVVERPSSEAISGYSLLYDIFGDPVLLLEVVSQRDIYMHSLMMVAYFAVTSILVGIIIAFVAIITMNRLVLSPLLRLSTEVNEIDPHAISKSDLVIPGDDELATLSVNIDNMLQTLNDYQRRLKESERMATIGETSAMVGHDLRNPLQVVYLLGSRLKKTIGLIRGSVDDSAVKELEFIEDKLKVQTVYMNKIVSDLQDFSRKDIKVSYEEVDLEKLVQEVIATLTLPENIDISTDFEQTLGSVQADGGLLRRVFTNLLTNAVQAMPDGGFIIVEGSPMKGMAKVSVSDTGPGISEENREKIFQPLFTTKAKGTGLGLAVCKRLVEAHGGEITFSTKEGVGTTFTVLMPLKQGGEQAPDAAELPAEPEAAAPLTEQGAQPASSF